MKMRRKTLPARFAPNRVTWMKCRKLDQQTPFPLELIVIECLFYRKSPKFSFSDKFNSIWVNAVELNLVF